MQCVKPRGGIGSPKWSVGRIWTIHSLNQIRAVLQSSRIEPSVGLRVGDRPPFTFGGYWLYLGGQAVLSRAQGELHGVTIPTFSMDLVVTPRRTGRLEIGPYRVAFDEVTGQKQRSFFDSPFDDLSVTKRAVVSSEPVLLDVRPLPEEGRPADFSGLIGVYSLEASAANTEANVGDPVPFSLTIHGPEPLGELKAPALEAQPGFAAQFKPAPEGWDAGAVNDSTPGQRTYSTTIRPTRDDVTQIPPIRLSYFDTATGRYEVALSKPIPLTVHPSKEFTLADAQRPGADGDAIGQGGGAFVKGGFLLDQRVRALRADEVERAGVQAQGVAQQAEQARQALLDLDDGALRQHDLGGGAVAGPAAQQAELAGLLAQAADLAADGQIMIAAQQEDLALQEERVQHREEADEEPVDQEAPRLAGEQAVGVQEQRLAGDDQPEQRQGRGQPAQAAQERRQRVDQRVQRRARPAQRLQCRERAEHQGRAGFQLVQRGRHGE